MKTTVKRLIKEEKGAALVLTLVLLLVGGLIMAPLLNFMGTGQIAGQVHEESMDQLYAADAGVEDAMWNIQHGIGLCPANPSKSYNIADVNAQSVEFTVTFIGGGTYKITSIATGADGSLTTIESHVSMIYNTVDFSGLLDYALSSDGTITIQPNSVVRGDIYIQDEENLTDNGLHEGEVKDGSQVSITWPTADQLSAYYLKDVEHLDPYPQSIIDIKNVKKIGPLYRQGSLEIRNTGSSATLELEDTIYVTGNLDFAQPGASKAYTIDLNGQTIFVEGDIYFPPQFVRLTGSGCIIAVGEIWFQPIMQSNPDDFVFVMSIDNQVWFNPNGDFTGAIAGEAHVQLQPNNYLQWIDWRDKPLNFPTGGDDDDALLVPGGINIDSWEIK